jgi:muramoyltetrapeptide carboxypeptidase
MVKPRCLRPGDRVAVVAPASSFPRDEFESGIAELTRLGFVPVYEPSVFDRRSYVAGDAVTRASAFRRALRDPGIAGILAARGGYGSVQLLPLLDAEEVRAARKPIVGYSDLTSLLTFVSGRCGLACFHGPTVTGRLSRGPDAYDQASFMGALAAAAPMGELRPPGEALVEGEARGCVFGGNLTQLAASLGTPFAFDPPPASILLLEDVNERPYRLDRLWTQLRLAGVIERASAIVFGDFPGCDEPGGEALARDVLADLVRGFQGPVLFGLPIGHTPGPALTIPLGVRACVRTRPVPALIIEEAAVDGP